MCIFVSPTMQFIESLKIIISLNNIYNFLMTKAIQVWPCRCYRRALRTAELTSTAPYVVFLWGSTGGCPAPSPLSSPKAPPAFQSLVVEGGPRFPKGPASPLCTTSPSPLTSLNLPFLKALLAVGQCKHWTGFRLWMLFSVCMDCSQNTVRQHLPVKQPALSRADTCKEQMSCQLAKVRRILWILRGVRRTHFPGGFLLPQGEAQQLHLEMCVHLKCSTRCATLCKCRPLSSIPRLCTSGYSRTARSSPQPLNLYDLLTTAEVSCCMIINILQTLSIFKYLIGNYCFSVLYQT